MVTQHLASRLACHLALGLACLGLLLAGCQPNKPPDPPAPKQIGPYPDLGNKQVPQFMAGTIFEQTESRNTDYVLVSSFGLIVGLRHTGDCTVGNVVRTWMLRQMFQHGMGTLRIPGFETMTPERVLQDDRVAIVEVGGWIPPGARESQRFDTAVLCLANNNTSSLAHGLLYQTALRIDGANPRDPGGSVNIFAMAEGDVFVNPAYSLNSDNQANSRVSLRSGTIPGGSVVVKDRPILLQLRHPSWALSRSIESRINNRFQHMADKASVTGGPAVVAQAEDQGLVDLYVPRVFNTDWEHFLGVATHIYLDPSPGVAVHRARQLAEIAIQSGAPLRDISYCWEAIGETSLPFLQPLMAHPAPEVAFAAARAGVFLGDRFAEARLMDMARDENNPYRLSAVQTLGALPNAPAINLMLAELLNAPEATIRIEAYRILMRNGDPHIFTKDVTNPDNPQGRFSLDVIDSSGPPLIYASRTGLPRIAFFGHKINMDMPVTFTAFDGRLLINSMPTRPGVLDIFYREEGREAVETASGPDVVELIARLAGVQGKLRFGYGDVVAMLQNWCVSKKIPAAFVLQETQEVQKQTQNAPLIAGEGPRVGATTVPVTDELPLLPVPPGKEK